jgi:L-malate glycosyltransferase
MRVAIVSHTSVHWTAPYARALLDRGHAVRVVSISDEPLDGIEVDYVGGGTPKRLKLPAHLARVPKVRKLLRAFAPDVVLAPYLSSNGMIAALAWHGPLVVSARGGDVLRQAGYVPGGMLLHRRMMRFVCGRAMKVHSVSPEIEGALVADGVPAGRIETFPLGVDTAWFAPTEPPPAATPPHVVCTRRQEPVYDNETLVTALAQVRREGVAFRATLVGGGPQLDERRAQVESLGLEDTVAVVGELPRERLREVLREAHVYVSASTSDGTSSSLLEAMACGLFPVVTSIPANQDWVADGETGILFAAGDASSLAGALAQALADERLREGAREANRTRIVQDGNLEANMRRMEHLLTEVAA